MQNFHEFCRNDFMVSLKAFWFDRNYFCQTDEKMKKVLWKFNTKWIKSKIWNKQSLVVILEKRNCFNFLKYFIDRKFQMKIWNMGEKIL